MTKRITVLLVDDEERFRITTAKILAHKGIRTLSAASGEEALAMFGENPDVVVLDIRMQGMGGEAALTAMKKLRPELPVIMLTGHGEQASAERAVEQGAYDYLTKPADLDLLTCKIMEAFRFGGAAERNKERVAGDLMRPISECVVLPPEATVGEAFRRIRQAAEHATGEGRACRYAGPSYLLVFKNEDIVGTVTMREFVDAVRPDYLADPQLRSRSVGSTWRYSPIFWNKLFTRQLGVLAEKPLGGSMTLPPPPIARNASLMEVCDLMHETSARSLIVMDGAVVVGVIGEGELYAEMARVVADTGARE